jgi:hypothetical protein
VAGALEGESLKVIEATSGQARVQKMGAFKTDRWSGDEQLFWTGAKPGDRLVLEISVPTAGRYEIAAALTMARDYAVVQLRLEGQPLGEALDLYHYPDVVSTGPLLLGERELAAGPHRLAIEIIGANDSAVKAHMVGLDYVKLAPK